jgi:tetratricopeptide (TPR) repeat protein
VWPCVLGLAAALCTLATASGFTSITEDPHPKIAIFGVDAGDWRLIDPLIASGRLPTFGRLKRVGLVGVLKADPPLLSPIIWTTIATGREPEDHGVLDFMMDLPGGGQAPVSGGVRRVKAFWEIWSKAGRRVLVTGWWATWPADPVHGVLVSDRITTPHLRNVPRPDAGMVFPAERWPEVMRTIVEPAAIGYPELARLVPLTEREFDVALAEERASTARLYRNPIAHFRAALAATRTTRRVSTSLVRSVEPDLWAAYYELTDTVCHLFIKDKARGQQAIASAYGEIDAALAETARALAPETVLLVISDHGFEAADAAIREDPADLTSGATAWHRPYGIAAVTTAGALAGTAPAPPAGSLGTITPLDVLPSLLARAGLPVAADMPGRLVQGLASTSRASASRVPTYGAHEGIDLSQAIDPLIARAELDRLRALGYVSGTKATSSLARVNLGEILFRKRDYRGALRELEALVRAEPLNERGSLWLARSYAALGRPDDALSVYDRLIQATSTGGLREGDPIVFLAATDLDLARRRLDGAALRLTRVPARLKDAPEVLTARGALAEAQGKTAEAERLYRTALDRLPSDTEALQRLVDLLLRSSRATEALVAATVGARAYPSSPTHLSLAGETALAGRQYPEAERYFISALALAPDAVSIRTELARAQLLQKQPEAALETLADVRSSGDVETLRGAALSDLGRWADAVKAFDRALAQSAPSPELLNGLGNAQLRAGRAAEAIKTLEQSLALKPDQPQIRALLETARQQKR